LPVVQKRDCLDVTVTSLPGLLDTPFDMFQIESHSAQNCLLRLINIPTATLQCLQNTGSLHQYLAK